MNSKDKELLNRAFNNESYQPQIALENFYNRMIRSFNNTNINKAKKIKNCKYFFSGLGYNLKTYFLAKGALENNLNAIMAACEINGRFQILGY